MEVAEHPESTGEHPWKWQNIRRAQVNIRESGRTSEEHGRTSVKVEEHIKAPTYFEKLS